jgi:predicted signal transduction protein with EAL and GGDEF domain
MWLSVGVSIFFLAVAAQVTVSSRHLMTTLNILIIAMLLNIHIQVLHGISPLIVWSIPFYLIWILIYPTVLVAIVGCLLTGMFIHFSPDHPVIGANWKLALTTACVAHFAKQALREQLQLAASDSLTGALNRRYLASQLETRRADFVRNQRVSSLVLIEFHGCALRRKKGRGRCCQNGGLNAKTERFTLALVGIFARLHTYPCELLCKPLAV